MGKKGRKQLDDDWEKDFEALDELQQGGSVKEGAQEATPAGVQAERAPAPARGAAPPATHPHLPACKSALRGSGGVVPRRGGSACAARAEERVCSRRRRPAPLAPHSRAPPASPTHPHADAEAEAAGAPAAVPAKKKKDKKKDKKGGKKAAAAFDSDDDEPKLLGALPGAPAGVVVVVWRSGGDRGGVRGGGVGAEAV